MQNVTQAIESFKQKIESVNVLKKGYENELEQINISLNELKDTNLKNLNNQKSQLAIQIDAELKKYSTYADVEKAFKELKDELSLYSKQQVMDLEMVDNTVKSYESLSGTVKEDLKTLNSQIQSEFIDYKTQMDAKITELTKNVEDVKIQINNEVTVITKQINAEIDELNLKIAELDKQIEASIESEKKISSNHKNMH